MVHLNTKDGLPTRYWGPFEQKFYSIHSFSNCEEADENGVCSHGTWHNSLLTIISTYMCKNHYKIWHAWVNRKYFNKTRTFLLKHFPKLR